MSPKRPVYPMRCKGCLYVLDGLDSGPCPECGRPFHPSNRTSYFQRPPYARWRFWFPGLVLALAGGAASIGALFAMGSLGTGLVLGTPLMIGALLGYGTRTTRVVAPILLGLALVVGLGTMLFTMQLAGIVCGLILVGIFAVPLLIGVWVGVMLRVMLRDSRFSMREYLPIVLMFMLPAVVGFFEKKGFSEHVELIATSRTLQISAPRAWNSLQFYEEAAVDPPILLRLMLPMPQGCSGERANPGDVTVCRYDGGQLTKRIVEVHPPQLLTFDVIDQQIEFDGAIHLEGGSFRFAAASANSTDATLETTYRSALRPRWVWRWGEELVVHALHEHVLQAIEAEAIRKARQQASAQEASR